MQSDLQLRGLVDDHGKAVVVRPCTNCHNLLPVRCFPEGGVALERLQCKPCVKREKAPCGWGSIEGEKEAGEDKDGAYIRSMKVQPRAAPGDGWDNPVLLSHEKHKRVQERNEAGSTGKSRRGWYCCVVGCPNKCGKFGKKVVCDEHVRVRIVHKRIF